MNERPEPWLRGPMEMAPAGTAGVLRAFQQVAEDLPRFTAGIAQDQLWAQPAGLSTIGFQLKHIAGSLDRLTTYFKGGRLSEAQLQALSEEHTPGAALPELLRGAFDALEHAFNQVGRLRQTEFRQTCYIGRERIPVTAIDLAIHMAEHTQRHLGQLIVLCRLAKSVPQ